MGIVAGQVKRAERDSQEGGAGDQDRRLHAHQRDQQEGQVLAPAARGRGPTLSNLSWSNRGLFMAYRKTVDL